MAGDFNAWAATLLVAAHLAVVAFNLFGIIAVPLGAWRGWRFVRVAWWRLLHIVLMAAVAAQALLGRACILTIWEAALQGGGTRGPAAPMIQTWMEGILYWDLPAWLFAAAYTALFLYVVALWRLVPPAKMKAPGPVRDTLT